VVFTRSFFCTVVTAAPVDPSASAGIRAHKGRAEVAPVLGRAVAVTVAAGFTTVAETLRARRSGFTEAARTMSDVASGDSGSREAASESSSMPLAVT
jgi:hypothetical protein